MSFIIVVLCLALLIVLISYFKVDAFIAFLISSILAGIALGIPLEKLPDSVNNGIGSILGGLTLIIVLGAMLGKLVAESGAAQKIASVMVSLFGTKHIQWGLMVTGFVVGIPLFYGIGFVLLVPLIFSIVYKYKLPAVYIGLPMLAALSVTHGFLPPHPSPVALVVQFNANIGLTLIYGLCLAIPAIIIAGPVFGSRLKHIKSGPVTLFEQKEDSGRYSMPGKANSFISATLPVFLLIIVPVCVGMAIRNAIPQIALQLGKPMRLMSIYFIFVLFFYALFRERANVFDYFSAIGIATALFCFLSLLIGYLVPYLAGVPDQQARSCCFEIGIHNTAVALTIALSVLQSTEIAIPSAIYTIFMYMFSFILGNMLARQSAKLALRHKQEQSFNHNKNTI